ncbi:MAG: UDP-3-O-(3-hydroxymyristoyl)glucosamine N-acyltransferase [Gammaproteobacteria bacterium]
MTHELAELARFLGTSAAAPVAATRIDRLAAPEVATATDMSFYLPGIHPRYAIETSAALAVLVGPADSGGVPAGRALIVDDVAMAVARVASWVDIVRTRAARPDARAGIADDASIARSSVVGRGVTIGPGSRIGDGVVIGPGVSVGSYSSIGAGSIIGGYARLGNRVHVGAGVVVGEDGFAFLADGEQWLRVPSFGSVTIEDDVELLAHVVIHAGVFSDTVIGRGCVLDSHVLIGHDARVGARTAIAGQSAVAGAASIGRGCRIGGKSAIGEGVTIADGVTLAAMSLVTRSIAEPGAAYASSWPAQASRTWWRQVARLKRLRSR